MVSAEVFERLPSVAERYSSPSIVVVEEKIVTPPTDAPFDFRSSSENPWKRYAQVTESLRREHPIEEGQVNIYIVPNVHRELAHWAGMEWDDIDALFGCFVPDGNISPEDEVQSLIMIDSDSDKDKGIGNLRSNVLLLATGNGEGLEQGIVKLDTNKPFKYEYMIRKARHNASNPPMIDYLPYELKGRAEGERTLTRKHAVMNMMDVMKSEARFIVSQ